MADRSPVDATTGGQGVRGRLRIAVVDHLSAGGVSRFLLALISHMAALYPECHITYYVSDTNIRRDSLDAKLSQHPNVSLRPMASPIQSAQTAPEQPQRGPLWTVPVGLLKRIPPLHKALLGMLVFAKNVVRPLPRQWWEYRMPDDVIAELAGYDVVYFGWPYYTMPVSFPVALVATFHDFHYRHFPDSYCTGQRLTLDSDTAEWLRRCRTAVTSTKFIRDELHRFYPSVDVPVEVIYLASYGFHRPTAEAIASTVEHLGLLRPYALFSGGRSGHKNLARILGAVGVLKQQGVPLRLVITGAGSQDIGLPSKEAPQDPIHEMNRMIEQYGLVRGEDYFPLGYVSNADVDALTAGADVVVSASLYEAGCGPAMDAWLAGVPVAMSAIPPFLEQQERFGVEAWVFDPLDVADIAEKLRSAVYDKARSAEMVARSLHAFEEYNWDDVAREYYRVLEEAAAAGPTERMLRRGPSPRRFALRRRTAKWFR
jgi:glycosyltransferase involved in cell wall biosynthesis